MTALHRIRYLRFACSRIAQGKVSFLFGLLSVFIVVVVTTVVGTALADVPVVFLQLAQADSGEAIYTLGLVRILIPEIAGGYDIKPWPVDCMAIS